MTDDRWDVVDQASFDSFPASDPPGYYTSVASTNAPEVAPRVEAPRWRVRVVDAFSAVLGRLLGRRAPGCAP